ncbi:hypothetical protein D1007_19884 [Hordeum vulgare]|nr:hypothetical protein D1007_19884 [Hordeum vulgare]
MHHKCTSADSTAQTGREGADDYWQEETYQMVKVLKDQYFAEIGELYNKISLKLQDVDNIIPPQMPSDKYDRIKSFQIMLDRILQMLQISKSAIQPSMRDTVPQYEKQIIAILNLQRKTLDPHIQQYFDPPAGQVLNSSISQQQEPSKYFLQQHSSQHAMFVIVGYLTFLLAFVSC